MGEAYGSTWTAMLYFIMVAIFFAFLIMGIEIVSFWGGMHKIEDGLKEGDFTVFNSLPHRFRVCHDSADKPIADDTYDSCTGLIAEVDTDGIKQTEEDILDDAMRVGSIDYQIEYDGMYIHIPAGGEYDMKAYLSY